MQAHIQVKDFTDRRAFPGTAGGPFDVLIRAGEIVERLSGLAFAALLLLLAALPTAPDWKATVALWLFCVVDWVLISMLPRMRISFGPAKPQALALAVLRLPIALLPGWWMWGGQLSGTLLTLYGFWIEPMWLEVTYHRLESGKLRPGTSLRIVHFGDLHMDRLRRLDAKLLHEIEDLKPDLILFSGDVLNYSSVGDEEAWEYASYVFKSLQAKSGVFAALGSPPVDRPEVVERIFRETPVRVLADAGVELEVDGNRLEIIGLRCSHKPFVDAPKLGSLILRASGRFRILLYHSPDIAPQAAKFEVDLQLSGHTHGGQVRLPLFGAIYASSLYGKRFESGRRQLGDMTLYVTRGVGLEGAAAPRVRFLCRPEIAVWDLSGPS